MGYTQMIHCYTNADRFTYDMGEMIRLFYPEEQITFYSEQAFEKQHQQVITFLCDVQANQITVTAWLPEQQEVTHQEPIQPSSDALTKKRFEKRALKRAMFLLLQPFFPEKEFPWGCLTGIRPTKMIRDLLQEAPENDVRQAMQEYYCVKKEKIDLAMTIIEKQKRMRAKQKKDQFDLYIGIPFCRTRCVYCSFAAYEMGSKMATPMRVEQYVAILQQEIKKNLAIAKAQGYTLNAIYVGGGTPTALSCDQLEKILLACGDENPIEFTVEAGRADTIDEEKLRMIKSMGVDRISINPQTIHNETLRLIGRDHTYAQFLQAYALARKVGFACINIDLIVGLPSETPAMMYETMQEMERLSPENLTIHTLAIKRSAELKMKKANYALPTDIEAEAMLAIGKEAVKKMGLAPYYMYRQKYMRGDLENVGYAKEDFESMYNVDIMEEMQNILALGAGGISKWIHGANGLERQANPKDIVTYGEKWEEMTLRRKKMMQK